MTNDRPAAAPTDTTPAELDAVLEAARAAQPRWAALHPRERADALVAVSRALDAQADALIDIAVRETGLGTPRLRGEVTRTTVQLRLFAEIVREGAYLDARIDEADDAFALGTRPDLRRVLAPVGVALNFAASNFPFAFSVAGGDSASALAAGCALVVKAHPGHPELSAATGAIVRDALSAAGAPEGTFAVIHGQQAGIDALRDDRVDVATFTGSTRGGRYLADIAAARPRPIPFHGELGSVNPVFVSEAALVERGESLAEEYVASLSGSAGQLCTKPGFVWVPRCAAGDAFEARVGELAAGVAEQRLLNDVIADGYAHRRDAVLTQPGVRVLAEGAFRAGTEGPLARPTVVSLDAAALDAAGEEVRDEVFGPFSVVVRYDEGTDLADAAQRLFPGSLTGTVHLAQGAAAETDAAAAAPLVAVLARTSGRVLCGGWPTGVAVTHAQQHGGPYPATTNDASTSVGSAAISRFLRGVAYQSMPEALLPPPLRDANPWGVPQRRSPAGESAAWT